VFHVIDKNRAEKESSLSNIDTNAAATTTVATSATTSVVGADAGMSIEIKSLSFAYPSRPACPVLQDVSVHIAPRQIAVLAGRSGSGKSSLLSLIAGLYTAQKGDILVGGLKLTKTNQDLLKDQVR
jgi:ABC-type bacteriocin/lantibiotic exporter with double-glycine peptidase domain